MSAIDKLRAAVIALIDAAEPVGELNFETAEEYVVPGECIEDLRAALLASQEKQYQRKGEKAHEK